MKIRSFVALIISVLVGFATVAPAKEISQLQRKQAATLASEAQFAMTLRDYARAERLFVQVVALCPDTGAYWVSLGAMQVRLGNRDAAKRSYEAAFDAFEVQVKAKPLDAEAALFQVDVIALLGRKDEARAQLAKIKKKFPNDRSLRIYVEADRLEKLLVSPRYKEIAL